MSTADPQARATDQATAEPHAETIAALREKFGADSIRTETFRDNFRVFVSREQVVDLLRMLRDSHGFAFLAELGAEDYLKYPGDREHRFEVHYVLLNHDTHERIIVKVGVDESDPTMPSVTPLWGGANWMEREAFDMYGIRFEGHPDLRRILMPEEFTAYPLRKDYPLRGRGERHNFPRLTREES